MNAKKRIWMNIFSDQSERAKSCIDLLGLPVQLYTRSGLYCQVENVVRYMPSTDMYWNQTIKPRSKLRNEGNVKTGSTPAQQLAK